MSRYYKVDNNCSATFAYISRMLARFAITDICIKRLIELHLQGGILRPTTFLIFTAVMPADTKYFCGRYGIYKYAQKYHICIILDILQESNFIIFRHLIHHPRVCVHSVVYLIIFCNNIPTFFLKNRALDELLQWRRINASIYPYICMYEYKNYKRLKKLINSS